MFRYDSLNITHTLLNSAKVYKHPLSTVISTYLPDRKDTQPLAYITPVPVKWIWSRVTFAFNHKARTHYRCCECLSKLNGSILLEPGRMKKKKHMPSNHLKLVLTNRRNFILEWQKKKGTAEEWPASMGTNHQVQPQAVSTSFHHASVDLVFSFLG